MEFTWQLNLTREQFENLLVALKEGCEVYDRRARQAKTLEDLMFWQDRANKSNDVHAYLFNMDNIQLVQND